MYHNIFDTHSHYDDSRFNPDREDLIGKSVVIVANLKPAKLCGEMSNGMLLAGDVSENDVKVLFVDGMPAGTKIR